MNRVGVFTSILETNPTVYTAGQLSIVTSKGDVVKAGATGPFSAPTNIDINVGLADGTYKQVITINPRKFSYKALAYAAAVGKTVRVGYTGSASNIVVADASVAANQNKFGTLTISRVDLGSGVAPAYSVHKNIQIVAGSTAASVLAALVAAATSLTATLNAKFGAGSVTFTSDVASANKYLQFVFAKDKVFNVAIDGIFDGTPVTVTAGVDGPIVSGLTGVEVRAKEREAAILDGYNPTQNDKYSMFDIDNYISAVGTTNYDALLITTRLDKEYESPANETSWDVTAILYADNTTPGTIGTDIAALVAILDEVKTNNGAGLTQAQADLLYAPLP